jgi:hypothetical protein
LAWTFEYIYQCQQSKRKVTVLKIDFEKAFDTIEHEAILKILKFKWFDDLFIKWVRQILILGSSSILLNGVLGRNFACKRGVRQGVPIVPLALCFGK